MYTRTFIVKKETKLKSCLLIAELSTENALTNINGYTTQTVNIATKKPDLVSGVICQKRCHNDPSFLYWTPGINLLQKSDGQGQQWRGVDQAILQDQCDIIIVGRGICTASDPGLEAKRYATTGWFHFISRQNPLIL